LNRKSSIQSTAIPLAQQTKELEKLIDWIKDDWLLKIGAFFLIIGFGWLATYAFLNDFIGPMGRISLGIIFGTSSILLGYWRMRNYPVQGSVFLVLGSTVILLTVFAARTVYGFFTPFSALTLMFLSTAFVAFASVIYHRRSLSLFSLIFAGIAPLLTNSSQADYVALFAYLFVVILGAIWIVYLTGQKELTLASLLIVSFYSMPHIFRSIWSSSSSADIQVLLLFAYAFVTLFFLTNILGILKSRGENILFNLISAAGNGLFLVVWIMSAVQDEWKSLVIVAWAIIFIVGAFIVFKSMQKREPFFVYAGIGASMLVAATSAELEGSTFVIAYTIETAIIPFIVYSILRDIKIAERTTLLFAGPMLLSLESISSFAWMNSVLHRDFFVLFVLGSCLFGLGMLFLPFVSKIDSKESKLLNALLLIFGSIYLYLLLWLSLGAAFSHHSISIVISLIIYTFIGLMAYFYGLKIGKKGVSLYGGVLIGFVVARLLLIDVWSMNLGDRIIVFFIVGTLLISTAFLRRKSI